MCSVMKWSASQVILLLTAPILVAAAQAVAQCVDIYGEDHSPGDTYVGQDTCTVCTCTTDGSTCSREAGGCKVGDTREAEVGRCVDNLGNIHQVGDNYTHVDGCNLCTCGELGGLCSTDLCQEIGVATCSDHQGRARQLGDSWPQACNVCQCGILGPVCTQFHCEKLVDRFGPDHQQSCRLPNGTLHPPGTTWLTQDHCNICDCTGSNPEGECSRVSCRVRFNQNKISQQEDCIDYLDRKHYWGEKYVGPDYCSICTCSHTGNTCTQPDPSCIKTEKTAEASRCIDNRGNIRQVGETYIHVDNCNTCLCTDLGGNCTKQVCKSLGHAACVDLQQGERELGESWSAGCNSCQCGILGAICTQYITSESEYKLRERRKESCKDQSNRERVRKNNKNSNGQPCSLENGIIIEAEETYLTPDSCNICYCTGNGTMASCSKVGCRIRFRKLQKRLLNGGESRTLLLPLVFVSTVLLSVFS